MDETVYTLLFIVIILLLVSILVVGVIIMNGEHSAPASVGYGINKNISKEGSNISNTLNTKLNNFTSSSTNTIRSSLSNQSELISSSLSSQSQNQVKGTASINHNLSIILLNQSQTNADLSNIFNTNGIYAQINASIIKTINKDLANYSTKNTPNLNSLILWTMQQTITPSNYIVYGLPDTMSNHIRINASAPIEATIMTIWQFANFSNGNSIQSIESVGSSGQGNQVNLWYNTTQGCSLYELVLTSPSSNAPVTLYPNVTGDYNPTAALQGICS